MRCTICRFSISKDDRKAEYISMWKERDGHIVREHKTGEMAHLVCLEGKPYDERQMTFGKEE